MCGVVTMTHLPGIHGTSIVVPLHLTNGCASTGKMFISQEKRNTPSRNFAFFPLNISEQVIFIVLVNIYGPTGN